MVFPQAGDLGLNGPEASAHHTKGLHSTSAQGTLSCGETALRLSPQELRPQPKSFEVLRPPIPLLSSGAPSPSLLG